MQIGIIGAGNVGNALAAGWIGAGHDVTFGIRDPETPPSGGPAHARYASVAMAMRGADAVVLAVPWPAVPDALASAGDLNGKLLIDCTNPLRMGAGADWSWRLATASRAASVWQRWRLARRCSRR
jgi:predicted dinucleotide-binding enzyme